MSKAALEIKTTQEQQGIEVLQEQVYQKLNERRIAAQRDLENARERLNELKAQARAKYNTDDITELERELEQCAWRTSAPAIHISAGARSHR